MRKKEAKASSRASSDMKDEKKGFALIQSTGEVLLTRAPSGEEGAGQAQNERQRFRERRDLEPAV